MWRVSSWLICVPRSMTLAIHVGHVSHMQRGSCMGATCQACIRGVVTSLTSVTRGMTLPTHGGHISHMQRGSCMTNHLSSMHKRCHNLFDKYQTCMTLATHVKHVSHMQRWSCMAATCQACKEVSQPLWLVPNMHGCHAYSWRGLHDAICRTCLTLVAILLFL